MGRRRQMTERAFWLVLITLLLAIGAIMVAVALARAADNDVPCLTKEQARAKYPGSYLYWHTENRCWDNQRSRRGNYVVSRKATWGKENTLKLGKPLLDASGNVLHHSGRPIIIDPTGPTIFYPTVIAGGGTSDTMLTPEAMNRWPVIVDFDVDPPLFIPWNERISAVFDK